MKRFLLGSSVLVGIGALAGTAQASDGIKLEGAFGAAIGTVLTF